MDNFLADNWEWLLIGFLVLEKIVKLSPSEKDDILFDALLKPCWEFMKKRAGK
tara:strand:+ start:2758 stop:2916 length:159 start_codon:yes stop_codon:yes gene_type:complete